VDCNKEELVMGQFRIADDHLYNTPHYNKELPAGHWCNMPNGAGA